jgi:hypothetical protein
MRADAARIVKHGSKTSGHGAGCGRGCAEREIRVRSATTQQTHALSLPSHITRAAPACTPHRVALSTAAATSAACAMADTLHSIPTSKLSARAARAEWCPSAEEDGSIRLPPEQRGKIGRFLADDEGEVPGRWMDVPMPHEVLGGAVGLTRAIVECVLLPIPGVEFTPTGGLPPQQPKREPLVPVGTELEERAPHARDDAKDGAAGEAAGALRCWAGARGHRALSLTHAPLQTPRTSRLSSRTA